MKKMIREIKMILCWRRAYHALDKMEQYKYDIDDYNKWRQVYVDNMNLITILNNMN